MGFRKIIFLFVACTVIFGLSAASFADKSEDKDDFSISPWGQIYSNFNYNISGYEDYDTRFDTNDHNSFNLTRVWFGVDTRLPKDFYGRIVLAATRVLKSETETAIVPSGVDDDPNTEEDESVQEVVTDITSTRTGEYGMWVTYAYFGYRPFSSFGVDMGMIPNAYNRVIYKYWRHNYVQFPTLYVHRMTRSPYGDLGASIFGDFPKGFGGYCLAVLNGEGKKTAETNAGKAFEGRVHIHPLASIKPMKGLGLMGFARYDKIQPDHVEIENLLFEGLLTYRFDANAKTGFSLTGEFAQNTMSFGDDTDDVVTQMYSFWGDVWFAKSFGFLARYDFVDPNTDNDKDGAGYQDEQNHTIAGFYFIPIKQVKLCLNYRRIGYTEQITDDNLDDVVKQPDQFVFLNTELKFK